MNLADSWFARFVSTPSGRILRAVVGLALIAWAGMSWGTTMALVACIVGLVFLAVGTFDVCLVSGFFGNVWSGRRIRARAAQKP